MIFQHRDAVISGMDERRRQPCDGLWGGVMAFYLTVLRASADNAIDSAHRTHTRFLQVHALISRSCVQTRGAAEKDVIFAGAPSRLRASGERADG